MSDLNVVSYGTTWKGLRNTLSPEPPILDAKEKKFNSLIPSRGNTPTLPLVATYNSEYGDGFVRGAIYFDEQGEYHEVSLDGETYDFIDGFDHGLARVYKIIGGQKRWGIIGLYKAEKGYEAKLCVSLKYDNIWNFYGKDRKSTPGYIGGLAETINLKKLQKEVFSHQTPTINDEPSLSPKTYPLNDDASVTKDEQSLIKKIEVSNFKRYTEPTSIDLSSRITFFVGKNNAGKSTFLDAIELCTRNMTEDLLCTEYGTPYFSFDKNGSLEVQAESFKKKLSKYAVSQYISYVLTVGKWEFDFLINRDALVEKIAISSTTDNGKIVITKGRVEVKPNNLWTFGYCFGEKWISYIPKKGEAVEYDVISQNKERYLGLTGLDRLLVPLRDIILNDIRISDEQKFVAQKMIKAIDNAITPGQGVERLHVFASIGSKKYKMPQTGNDDYPMDVDFVTESISGFFGIKEKYHQFVCKWLGYMEMGTDFTIEKNDKDDSYTMTIMQDNGVESDLCDMGSGIIHFVALCFKLLSIIEAQKKNDYAPTVLIEEPEQNLHPMLQSHMANFLLDVSDLYKEVSNGKELKMVVETHSEYIIRRSQIIVKASYARNESNPFRVYYFPSNNDKKKEPYDMLYQSNGRFVEKFGNGFTDESTLLSYQLL